MNELERIETGAMREVVLLGGGDAEHVGGALCLAQPRLPITELNRAIPLGAAIDVAAIEDWYAGRPFVLQVTPERDELAAELERRGYRRGHGWMKFERGPEPSRSAETELHVEETGDPGPFGLVGTEGFGMPPQLASLVGVAVGRPGWHCFVAWANGEPAGCGALFVDGGAAWLGIAATRPAFRRRGAQNAILGARIEAARALGAGVLVTETGERGDDGPGSSYRNILRAGFREAYVRANWQAP